MEEDYFGEYAESVEELTTCKVDKPANNTRKVYKHVPDYFKSLPEYKISRKNNSDAVKRYRERSKKNAKLFEEGKEHFTRLKQLYDNELERIESTKQKFELLLYQHSTITDIKERVNDLAYSESLAKSEFQSVVGPEEAKTEAFENSLLTIAKTKQI